MINTNPARVGIPAGGGGLLQESAFQQFNEQAYGSVDLARHFPSRDRRLLLLEDVPERRERWAEFTEDYDTMCAFMGKDPVHTRVLAEVAAELMLDSIDEWERSQNQMVENTLAANFAAFQRQMLIPVNFELWPRLLATELFATQPMAIPTAPIFFERIHLTSTSGTPRATTVEGHDANYSADPGEATAVSDLELRYTSTTVTAISRKVRTLWSAEAGQDAQALYNVNISARAMQAATNQLAMETDLDLLTDCIASATNNDVSFNASSGQSLPTEIRAHREGVFDAMIDANSQIFQRKYRGANWIACNYTEAARLEKVNGFQVNPAAGLDARGSAMDSAIGMSSRYLGQIANKWRVFVHPWLAAGTYLMGYRGNNPVFDAGYMFCPFVRMFVTPDVWNPANLTVARAHMTRYGKTMVDADQYARVQVTNPSLA